jgi:hypothetical protein
VLREEPFIEGPGSGSSIGDAPRLVGAEGFAFGAGEDLGDGQLGGCGLVGGFDAPGDRARKSLGGDLAIVGESPGFGGAESAGENAVGDLGEDELDGGVIFEKGHGDTGTLLRALRVAVLVMGVAVELTEDGGGVALESIDAEGAAAARGEGGRGNFGNIVEVGGGGHWILSEQRHRAPGTGHSLQSAHNEKGRSMAAFFGDGTFPDFRVGNFQESGQGKSGGWGVRRYWGEAGNSE